MDNLLHMIEKEKASLTSKLNSTDDELEFFNAVFNSPNKDVLDSLSGLSKCDLLVTITLCNNSSYSIQEICTLVDTSEEIIENFDNEKMEKLAEYIEQAERQGSSKELIELFDPNRKFKPIDTFKPGYDIYLNIKDYFAKENVHPKDFRLLLAALLSENSRFWCEQLIWADVISTYLAARKNAQKSDFPLTELNNMAKCTVRNIMTAANNIIRHYDNLRSSDRSRKKAIRKSIFALDTLEEQLPQLLKRGEIENYEDLIKGITDPEIRLEALKLIYKHNMAIYKKMEEEYRELSSSRIIQYQSLLRQYGLSADEKTVEDMMTSSLDDVESMLKLMPSLGITNPTTILSIIKRSNVNTLYFLSTQVSKGIISPELLQERPDIFSADSSNFKCLSNNLAFLKASGLNPHYLDGNKDLFILPTATLQQSFQTLGAYDLLSSLKPGQDYSFLGHDNLESGIDTLLELGYESMLEENPSLLNYQDKFNRLRLLKDLNIPVDSIDTLLEVLTSDSFLVADSSLGEYLYNAATCRHDGIKKVEEKEISPLDYLENLPATKRTYNIDGVIISKNRVQRNLNQTEDPNSSNVLYAVTNGATLSDLEYDKIVSHMTRNKDQKEKVKSQESA